MNATKAASALDVAPMGGFQFLVLLLCLAALIGDGLAMQLLSFAAPVVMKEWGITSKALAPAMAAVLLGMALGAWMGGILGDRLGRRTILVATLGIFGVTTAATALAQNVPTLAVVRLLSGIACGAATPNAIALVTEWVPRRFRTLSIGVLVLGTGFGGMLGAALAASLLISTGWRSLFIVSGLATVALCALMIVLLPDSIEFLIRCEKLSRAQALLARVLPSSAPPFSPISEPRVQATVVGVKLFSRRNLRVNVDFVSLNLPVPSPASFF